MKTNVLDNLSRYAGITDENTPRLLIHKNKLIKMKLADGIIINTEELEDHTVIDILVEKSLKRPVHICFAILNKTGKQSVNARITVKDNSKVHFISHCVFPNAEKVVHKSNIQFQIGHGALVKYEENHIHSQEGDIKIDSKVHVNTGIKSKFDLSFTATHGRVGKLNSSTDIHVGTESSANVIAKILGKKDDYIVLNEKITLEGCESRGIVKTRNVLTERSKSVVNSEITGLGIESRGHIDCTEILMDEATAMAYPIVNVQNPTAKLTHEAAIGRVDKKQIITLLCRGLSEEEATDFIVQGLLR